MREAETGSGAGTQPDAGQPTRTVRSAPSHGPAGPIDQRLVSLLAPDFFEAVQYRTLRHVVEERRGETSVIAVTRAAAGVGRATRGDNLAAALAQDAESR